MDMTKTVWVLQAKEQIFMMHPTPFDMMHVFGVATSCVCSIVKYIAEYALCSFHKLGELRRKLFCWVIGHSHEGQLLNVPGVTLLHEPEGTGTAAREAFAGKAE